MITKRLKPVLILSTLMMSYSAFAYNTSPGVEQCKKPRFDRFSLPIYKVPGRIEVAPESEFSFTLSSKVAADTVKLTIKNKELPYKIEAKNSFYRITSKIPAEYTGKFVRINASVIAKLECKGKDGWLIKVAEAKTIPKVDEKIEAQPANESDCEN